MPFRVLVTDDIEPEGVALLASEPRLRVDEVPTLPKEELLARIGDYDAIVGRSATRISADVLRSFGSAFGGQHRAIVGGAVPSLLIASPPAGIESHVGTADIDLHLSLHILDGETADYYDSIIDGLRSLGLEADRDRRRQSAGISTLAEEPLSRDQRSVHIMVEGGDSGGRGRI